MADTLPKTSMDPSRRAALVSTCVVGCAGAAGVAIPLVSTFQPSERAKAAGAPVEADIAGMAPGELRRVEWRGKPVWLIRRTPKMLESLNETQSQVLDPDSDGYYQIPTPEYAKNQHRSIKPEYLVVVGICSHLGVPPANALLPGPSPRCPTTGPAASCAPVMAPPSTWRVGSSRTSRPTPTSTFPPTSTRRTPRC